jgi:hypothetical protein
MVRLRLVLTADYEIHGDGSGDVRSCLLAPTERLLALCEAHGTRMTLFVDVCELWAFRAVEDQGRLPAGYAPATWIEEQLRDALRRGHDVQLHCHPHWLEYRFEPPDHWQLSFEYWRLSQLRGGLGQVDDRNSLRGLFAAGKKTLEELLRPEVPSYRCQAFRAGAWCIQPEEEILIAMREQGLRYDTTVAPGLAYDDGRTIFDFRAAPRDLPGWPIVDRVDRPAASGDLYEVPIFTCTIGDRQDLFDYCQFDAEELGSCLEAAKRRFRDVRTAGPIPLVAIGHPKALVETKPLEELLNRVEGDVDVDIEPLTQLSLWQRRTPLWLGEEGES